MPDSQRGRPDFTTHRIDVEKPLSPEMEAFIRLLGRLVADRWRKISHEGLIVETKAVGGLFAPEADNSLK
jgi:hypothetical protein